MLNLLILVSLVGLCYASVHNIMGEVSSRCVGARTSCAASMLTWKHCRSTWHSLQFDMIRLDTNNDCEIDGNDYVKDMRDNYNLEDDDKICKREFITRSTNVLGFSTAYSEYVFDQMYPSGCGDMDEIKNEEPMKLKTDFLNSAIQYLIDFCKIDENMRSNLDCWNLPSLCKEMSHTLPACRQFRGGYLTLYEQLQLFQGTNDDNSDGIITFKEMNTNLRINFDRNGDGCVSRQEFIRRWTTFYRFSRRLADTVYSIFDRNSDNCVTASDMKIPSQGSPADTFPKLILKAIINMCEQNQRYYKTVRECALVSETCETRFSYLEECKQHFGNCGLESYASCVDRLKNTVCFSEADMYELKFEKLKIYNQINDSCTVELMNGSERLQTGLFFTLLPMTLTFLTWH